MYFDFTKPLLCSIYEGESLLLFPKLWTLDTELLLERSVPESLFLNLIHCVQISSVLLTIVCLHTWACQENPTSSSLQLSNYEIMWYSWCVWEVLDFSKIRITLNLVNETVIEQKVINCHVIITWTFRGTCMIKAKSGFEFEAMRFCSYPLALCSTKQLRHRIV